MSATLNVEEAAKELGFTPRKTRQRFKEFGGWQVGREVRFDPERIAQFKRSEAGSASLRRPLKTVQELAAALDALTLVNREREQQAERDRAEIASLKDRLTILERNRLPMITS